MEFKHFSHPHNLSLQQIPQGSEIHCSGCNSPASGGSFYTCWQCGFHLHDQCFNAARSLNHPSHPSHPLTLLPSPTYPSSSFFCNSCNLTGTGLSYSCSRCDFDLHIHCAFPPAETMFPALPNQNSYSFPQETPSFGPPPFANYAPETAGHESVPSTLSPQFNNFPNHQAVVPETAIYAEYNFPNSAPIINPPSEANQQPTHFQYPPVPAEAASYEQYNFPPNHTAAQFQPVPEAATYESVVSYSPNLQYGFPNQTTASVNPLPQSTQYQSVAEAATHESAANFPNPQYSFPNQTTAPVNAFPQSTEYQPVPEAAAAHESVANPLNPQYSFPNQTTASVNAFPQSTQYQPVPEAAAAHESVANPLNPQYSFPNQTTASVNPLPQTQYQPVIEATSHESSASTVPMPHYPPKNDQPLPKSNPINPTTNVSPASENQTQLRNVKHFSHHHALRPYNVPEEDYVLCSGCEQYLSGSAYSCSKPRCNFHLHKSCFELPRELQHKSHPKHALALLSSPPYKLTGEFTCNACLRTGAAFTYHCKSCNFDLHAKCASLPQTMKRKDHEHPLNLLYSTPYKKGEGDREELLFYCDVCEGIVDERCWVYYCEECDYGTDLACATVEPDSDEEGPETGEEEARGGGESGEYSAESAELQMKMLQLQLEMSKQQAQMITSMGQSLANLV
ncbi:uncharacterized protein LOC127802472 [Diospyros lotus]|uniref:uncharacterized protein LOC127802472 n=1 Tax=Diospyros lotus TaxID=55363 RepID=UPI0022558BEA|nr:uncharacterized protein LOC127802472 [Diospyros lotus]